MLLDRRITSGQAAAERRQNRNEYAVINVAVIAVLSIIAHGEESAKMQASDG